MPPSHRSRQSTKILVVANETVASEVLHVAIRSHVEDPRATEVLLAAPALNSRLRYWLSDVDDARRDARRRLEQSLERLADAGIEADGVVGDSDPLQAIEDALNVFPADRIVIATYPEGRSNWLARDLVGRTTVLYQLPVTHIVVDREADREYLVPLVAA